MAEPLASADLTDGYPPLAISRASGEIHNILAAEKVNTLEGSKLTCSVGLFDAVSIACAQTRAALSCKHNVLASAKLALTDLTLQTHHDVVWMVLCSFGEPLNQPPAQKL